MSNEVPDSLEMECSEDSLVEGVFGCLSHTHAPTFIYARAHTHVFFRRYACVHTDLHAHTHTHAHILTNMYSFADLFTGLRSYIPPLCFMVCLFFLSATLHTRFNRTCELSCHSVIPGVFLRV